MKKFLLAVCAVSLCAGISLAKEAPKKVAASAQTKKTYTYTDTKSAIGYDSQLAVPAVAYRYWGADKIGFEGLLGYSSGENDKHTVLGGKFLSKIKTEQNLTLYWFGMVGIDNYKTTQSVTTINPFTGASVTGSEEVSDSETTIGAGLGVEFFFQGLPNLSFGAEMGIANRNKAKVTAIFADWIPSVGIKYYYK